jgi:hypothetical protein
MSQRTPSEALQRTWLKAVLLPGIDDPRESGLTELVRYTGRSFEEVLARCRIYYAVQGQWPAAR